MTPIPMMLFCPACGAQHVDAPDPAQHWDNPPHRSHLCGNCGVIWRPADVETVGVLQIETRSAADTFPKPGWPLPLPGLFDAPLYERVGMTQSVVSHWVSVAFGKGALKPRERAARLLEHASKLANAEGIEPDYAQKILKVAYGAPPAPAAEEAGGVGLCLLAWAAGSGLSTWSILQAELHRVRSASLDHFRALQQRKIAQGISAPREGEQGGQL